MSDNNSLGQSQFASQQCSDIYGLQGSFGGFWGNLLGGVGITGSCSMMFSSYDEYARYVTRGLPVAPDADGWYEYIGNAPTKEALCQFKQGHEENEGEPWVGYADFHPEFNVAYLKWRYTGISKEQGYGK